MKVSSSLHKLDNVNIPDSEIDSHVISECKRLYKLPLSKLSVEDLRLLIGQKIGLKHLVPIALKKLECNPLVDGGLYAGDLLSNVTDLPKEFWLKHPEYSNQLVEIKITVESLAETLNNDILPKLSKFKFG